MKLEIKIRCLKHDLVLDGEWDRYDEGVFKINPCEDCIKEAEAHGEEEGYERGQEDADELIKP